MMINLFDPPREKARKNIRILKILMLTCVVITVYFVIVQNWLVAVFPLCLISYFLGAFITLKNVMRDLKE